MMPACIRGVINLRGAVVPVMDLAVRFGRRRDYVTKRTCIVIVEVRNGRRAAGDRRDGRCGQRGAGDRRHRDRTAAGVRRKIRADFIEGMGKVNGKFVILLDVGCVMSTAELDALAKVEASNQDAAAGSLEGSAAEPAKA